jgi:FdhE protein
MTQTPASARILSPEEIAVRAGQAHPFLRLPERSTVFADRALRLRQLAAGHAMRDFLIFAADVADAQHLLLADMPEVVLPDSGALAEAANAGLAPLPATGTPRDPVWRDTLSRLLAQLSRRLPVDAPPRAAIAALRGADDQKLERQADRLLNGVMRGLDLGMAPLIGAALQVDWTHRVLAVQQRHGQDRIAPFGRTDDSGTCPCCASRPTASITRIGAEETGYRFLHCSLCSTQWHLVRIKCSHCLGTQGISYQGLTPADAAAVPAAAVVPGAVQAETCEVCHQYLKIVHMERDAEVEPVADDLASLTLDLLVSESGMHRHGVNLMLLFGDPEPPPDPNDSSA